MALTKPVICGYFPSVNEKNYGNIQAIRRTYRGSKQIRKSLPCILVTVRVNAKITALCIMRNARMREITDELLRIMDRDMALLIGRFAASIKN
jgi:hypothetical protein